MSLSLKERVIEQRGTDFYVDYAGLIPLSLQDKYTFIINVTVLSVLCAIHLSSSTT